MAYIEGEVPTVVNGNGNNGFGNGFGDSWVALILFALIFGNGNFGWGGNNGAETNYVLNSDFATLERQMTSGFNSLERKGDYIQEQLCNQTENMLNGFNTVNTNVMQTGFGITNALNSGFNDVNSNLAQIRYDSAINNCNLQHAMCQNTRDIIDSQNAGTRAILDRLTANELAQKNETIDMLRSQVSGLQLSASQQAQNNYLVSRLAPNPIPSYQVPNPNIAYYYGGTPFGFGTTTTIQ